MKKEKLEQLRIVFKDILTNILMGDFGEDGYYEEDLNGWVEDLLREVKIRINNN